MKRDADYYVYAYFDPRNYEIFYVGKGQGSRKNAHRPNKLGTAKERQLHEIKRSGLEPLIKVVAASLTEDQAFLVEKALIWRSGKWLTNINSGKYKDNFRRSDTLHLSLPGFDTTRGVYAVNVTTDRWRHWDDFRKYGFVSAGYGRKFSSQLERLEAGDIVAPYLGGRRGYVGIGRVVEPAVRVGVFRFKGRLLKASMLAGPDLLHDAADANECEYLVRVDWKMAVPQEKGRFVSKAGLYAPFPIVASLSNQPKTMEYLEREFGISFSRLLASN